MITCPNCGKPLPEGAKFCGECGARISVEEKTIFCPYCGQKTSASLPFCQQCGASIAEDAGQSESSKPWKKNFFQAIPRKFFMIGGAAAAALVLLVLVISLFAGHGSGNSYSLYLKDNEICYMDLSKNTSMEVTSRLVNDSFFSDYLLANSGDVLGSYVAFSEDGKRIFFPDKLDTSNDEITLYFRDLKKPERESTKVDTDVSSYAINRAGDRVVYIKGSGSDGILYTHNLKEKDKIASDVISFHVADDCKKVSYLTSDKNYYLWTQGKGSQKLASEISSIEHVSEDLSVVYYIKDGALYKQAAGQEDKEKIASDVSQVVKIYDSGELYYTKADAVTQNLIDYVTDDMAAADAAMAEPEKPTYPDAPSSPSWWNYGTDEEYQAAKDKYNEEYAAYKAECERLNEEYKQAYELYRAKVSRDALRENLAEKTMDRTEYSLYFFDGKEASVVSKALVSEQSINTASKKPVVVLQTYNAANVPSVKLSEIESAYELSSLVDDALYSSSERHVAVGNATTVLEENAASNFAISANGDAIYFMDDISDEGSGDYGDLYKVSISKGQVGSPELYDESVYRRSIRFVSDNSISYFKNMDDRQTKGDLFIDKTEIDYDVKLYDLTTQDDKIHYYYTDWNSEKSYGTLMMSKNGKKTKIADDVHAFMLTDGGELIYLYDYSVNSFSGTLFRYNSGKSEKIDEDVVTLLPLSDNSIRGNASFGW